jgi:hypothetical protein
MIRLLTTFWLLKFFDTFLLLLKQFPANSEINFPELKNVYWFYVEFSGSIFFCEVISFFFYYYAI